MKSYAVLDVETTIKNNGNVFTPSNKLVAVGIILVDSAGNRSYRDWTIEYDGSPYGDKLRDIKSCLESVPLIIGHNAKFDLHWVRRYIPDVAFTSVWDTQLAEFVLSDQIRSMVSLEELAAQRLNEHKLDIVRTEYWDIGLDTTEVPVAILRPYLRQDCELTEKIYLQQDQEFVDPKRRMLFKLQCADLLVLAEMEWNGILYDFAAAAELAKDAQEQVAELNAQLRDFADDPDFDPGSSDQLSCLLYGGVVHYPVRETYERILKDGTVKVRERWANRPKEYARLISPSKGTETKPTAGIDEGDLLRRNIDRESAKLLPWARHYSVAEPVLRRLSTKGKAARIVDAILRRAEIAKLDSTYYTGLLNLKEERGWRDGCIHGQFNQTIARTGRLSSSSPNLQNMAGSIKHLFYTRY